MGWIAQGAGERWAATGSDKAWMGELTFWLWSAVWKPVGVEDTGCNPQSVHKTKLIITKPHSNHFRSTNQMPTTVRAQCQKHKTKGAVGNRCKLGEKSQAKFKRGAGKKHTHAGRGTYVKQHTRGK